MVRKDLPQNIEAERRLLGAILAQGELLDQAAGQLTPKDFHDPRHRGIFQAALDTAEQGKPVDIVTVPETMKASGNLDKVGGASYLANLPDSHTASFLLTEPIRLIKEDARRREIILQAEELAALAREGKKPTDSILAHAQDQFQVLEGDGPAADFEELGQAAKFAFAEFEAREAAGGQMAGLDTGFVELNRMTGGLKPEDLIVAAGSTSHGKSALSLNIAERAAEQGNLVLIFPTEMGPRQLAERQVCSWSETSSATWRFAGVDKKIAPERWSKIVDAVGRCQGLPILISTSWGQRIDLIRSAARREARRQPVGLIVVDYRQQVKPARTARNREQEVANISWNLKEMARELHVPVLAISQLNRELSRRATNGTTSRPRSSDLRESGAIEQDADVVLLVHHPLAPPGQAPVSGKAELIVAKNRHGPTGVVPVRWNGERYRFQNLITGDL